jgi:hypothetical protein
MGGTSAAGCIRIMGKIEGIMGKWMIKIKS